MKKRQAAAYILSTITVRRTIGLLGIFLPVIMAAGGFWGGYRELQETVSHYYYTNMRDLFTGVLCAVGLSLAAYRGYDLGDRVATMMAGFAVLVMALFPTSLHDSLQQFTGIFLLEADLSNIIHTAASVVFFAAVSFITLFLFTRTGKPAPTARKKLRNRIYRICGFVILGACLLIPVYTLVPALAVLKNLRPVFWMESVALAAFGVSWLVKGESVLRD